MVLTIELCCFSGAKIYPGKGIRFIRADSQVFLFANSKCKRYLKPSKLTWTAVYPTQHKKARLAELEMIDHRQNHSIESVIARNSC